VNFKEHCDTHVYASQPDGFFNHEPCKTATVVEADKFPASLDWLKGAPKLPMPKTNPDATEPAEREQNEDNAAYERTQT
jgi:hypothetical protein